MSNNNYPIIEYRFGKRPSQIQDPHTSKDNALKTELVKKIPLKPKLGVIKRLKKKI